MAGKRSSTTRPRAESSRRGRPRRAVRSAYATAEQEGPEDDVQPEDVRPKGVQPEAGQDPPPTAGPAQPTATQELQLLQA